MLSVLSFVSSAQNSIFSYDSDQAGIFIDAHFGTRIAGKHSTLVTPKAGYHIDGGLGYMLNENFGIKGDLAFDTYKSVNHELIKTVDRAYSIRASVQAVFALDKLILNKKIKYRNEKIGLNAHGGFGFLSLVNPSWKEGKESDSGFTFSDPLFKGNDDMLNFLLGITPRYMFNENISIDADISYVIILKQDYTLDRYNNIPATGFKGFLNAAIGLTYTF